MGWCSETDSDDEPMNLRLFMRKSFGFRGLPAKKEEILKCTVESLGASCDDSPKYVFTTSEYFHSLTNESNLLYNVTYIRDCIDANKCLSIENYRFGINLDKKGGYQDFDPCCYNFHNGADSCTVCDSTLESGKITEKTPAKVKEKRNLPNSWKRWEQRRIVDYIIRNDRIRFAKGPNVYKQIAEEGVLKSRTAESMRVQFRTRILPEIEKFNLPKPILQKFKLLQTKGKNKLLH